LQVRCQQGLSALAVGAGLGRRHNKDSADMPGPLSAAVGCYLASWLNVARSGLASSTLFGVVLAVDLLSIGSRGVRTSEAFGNG
jgi:hypothetical protein